MGKSKAAFMLFMSVLPLVWWGTRIRRGYAQAG